MENLYPPIKKPAAAKATPLDAAVANVERAYSVRTEAGADVLNMSFKHKDRLI